MDPSTLAEQVAAQERRAQEEREHAAQAASARAHRAGHYVTFDHYRDMARLTIRGHSWRLTVGGAILAGTLFMLPIALDGNTRAWLLIAACALVALVLIVRPRSTVRLLATPQHFAVYGRDPDRPWYTGLRCQLEVHPYHWRSASGIKVRVWNQRYWLQTYTGIRHPDDFAALAAWNACTAEHHR
jgi:hypothetical protein